MEVVLRAVIKRGKLGETLTIQGNGEGPGNAVRNEVRSAAGGNRPYLSLKRGRWEPALPKFEARPVGTGPT